METFDVVVVGGGMMGAPCARHLAESGHSVALVAPPEPSLGGNGPRSSHADAARIARRLASDPDWSRLACRSMDRYADLEARSGRRIFRRVGSVMAGPIAGPMAAATKGMLRVARGLATPPEMLDAGAARARFGFALPECSAVAHEPGGGWIDPRAMRDAQVGLAVRAGARRHAQAAMARDGGTVTLADGTRIAGARVVVATGPHAGSDGLLPRVPALQVFARTVLLARVSEAEGARLAAMPTLIWVPDGWDHDLYLLPPVRYPDGGLWLKVGGQREGPRIPDAAGMTAWYRGAGDAQVGARLAAELRRVLPGLAIEETRTAPCAVTWTATGHPFVERADDRVVALCGGNGAAAKSGDEIGRLGALVASGGDLGGEGYGCGFGAVWEAPVTATSPRAAAT